MKHHWQCGCDVMHGGVVRLHSQAEARKTMVRQMTWGLEVNCVKANIILDLNVRRVKLFSYVM